jgi:transcriptional antiterminator NusG
VEGKAHARGQWFTSQVYLLQLFAFSLRLTSVLGGICHRDLCLFPRECPQIDVFASGPNHVCGSEGEAMSSGGQLGVRSYPAPPPFGMTEASWYAVHTRARHERVVEQRLRTQGLRTFLPITTEWHSWSDRRKLVEVPLFSCYLFVRSAMTAADRHRIVCTEGTLRVVGDHGQGTPISDDQIESIRVVLEQKVPCLLHPFLKFGQRVRIRGGALDGIEGVFLSCSGDDAIVISVDAIQRSLAIRLSGYRVEAV